MVAKTFSVVGFSAVQKTTLKVVDSTKFQPIYINNSTFSERKAAPKLKLLAKKYLSKDIHTGNRKHNPVVDALTCIELMRTKIKSERDRHMINKILTKKIVIVCV